MAGLPLVGACVLVVQWAGAKLGGVAAVGGSILGYTRAMVIKEHRELRTYIDDHYKTCCTCCLPRTRVSGHHLS